MTRTANYTTREQLDFRFGKSNIEQWADLNNNRLQEEITDRVTWAIGEACDEIDGFCLGGPYEVPFADIADDPATPALIRQWATIKAGLMLYDGRGHDDGSTNDYKMLRKRDEEFPRTLRRLRVRLDVTNANLSEIAPQGLDDDSSASRAVIDGSVSPGEDAIYL